MEVKLRESFRENAQKAILAIVLFIFVYLVLLGFGVVLASLCVMAGLALGLAAPHYITILIAIGLAAAGLLVLIFLIKFIFKKHRTDLSHLKEIKRSEEPRIFSMIDEIVEKLGTDFPKHVYLSSHVNASVFYDSGFWSMFFPVRKNLEIGLGLVNTLHETELKAVLAHEFGHFSQRSMKIGSYVYQVNQVIFNLLYDNESFEKGVRRWVSMSAFFSLFVLAAYRLIQAIQWILGKMYAFVNQKYMALSREMEFHADEMAARVTGFEPLQSALLRFDVSHSAMESVFQFYTNRIVENKISANIFNDQITAVEWIARHNQLAIENGLPQVQIADVERVNRSKLVVADQWASHPRVEDRIRRLELTELRGKDISLLPANQLFENLEEHQLFFNQKIFHEVKFAGEVEKLNSQEFKQLLEQDMKKNSFPEVFRGYFDNRILQEVDWKQLPDLPESFDITQAFSDKWIDVAKEAASLEADINSIKFIYDNKTAKSFDYDGKKFSISKAKNLIDDLEKRLLELNEKFHFNELQVLAFCLNIEMKFSSYAKLIALFERMLDFQTKFQDRLELYMDIQQKMQFVTFEIPIEQILENLNVVRKLEQELKSEMQEIYDDSLLNSAVESGDMHITAAENMFKYLEEPLEYFSGERYLDHNLNLFFEALNSFNFALLKLSFLHRRAFLEYLADLIDSHRNDKNV